MHKSQELPALVWSTTELNLDYCCSEHKQCQMSTEVVLQELHWSNLDSKGKPMEEQGNRADEVVDESHYEMQAN